MTGSLVPLQPRAIALQSTMGGQVVSKSSPPPLVQTGIKNLLIAFAAGPTQHTDDRVQLLRIYAGACEGFEVGIVDYVLQRLLYNNPRNPFPPSPQDVHELCAETFKVITGFAARYRLLITYRLSLGDEHPEVPADYWKSEWGARPDEEGCLLSYLAIMEEVRKRIKNHERALIGLKDEQFQEIPIDAFPEGYRDSLTRKREQRAYEASLSAEEREAREIVLCRLGCRGPTEEEIRLRTAEHLRFVRGQRGSDAATDQRWKA